MESDWIVYGAYQYYIIGNISMSEIERSQDTLRRRNAAESVELAREQKEKQVEAAEKKLAAKERIEVTSKEIKTTKNQIQNIVANMSQVVKAVAAIRAQLGLSAGGAIPSVAQDEKALAALRTKLEGLIGEIAGLQVALLAEEVKNVKEENPNWSVQAIDEEANKRVEDILKKLDIANY